MFLSKIILQFWTHSTRSAVIFGQEVYLATAYFVDPTTICDGGRTQGDYNAQGTGYGLFFQNGDQITDIIEAPLTVDEADNHVSQIKG